MATMTTHKICKVAFIGAGYMAAEHLKAFKDVPGVALSGIYSRSQDRAHRLAEDYGIKFVCESVNDLFVKTSADLVIVAVPELEVREVCFETFLYPWVCLIEKPAGYNLEDAEIIAMRALSLESRAYVALNRRHHSSTDIVLADLSKIDGPRLIHIYDQEDQISARKAGQPELVVQNWMYANSIHVVDYLSILARGRVKSVEKIIPWTPQSPSFVLTKVEYDSGDIGIYEAIWNGPGPWAVTVTTQQKRWEMRPLEAASFQEFGSRKLQSVPVHDWDTKFKPGLRVQAEEAVKAAIGVPHNLPSLSDALKSMKLVDAIYGDN